MSSYLKQATRQEESGTALALPTGRPEAPEFLAGTALNEWDRICDLLESVGLLSLVSRDRIARYVQAWETYSQIQREWNKMPLRSKLYPKKGAYDPYYWIKMLEMSIKEINAFESEYGLTPLAGSRLSFPKKGDDATKQLDDFLKDE